MGETRGTFWPRQHTMEMLRRVYEASSSLLWPKKRKLDEGPSAEPEGKRVRGASLAQTYLRQEDVVSTSQDIVASVLLTEESVSPAVIRPLCNGSLGCTMGEIEGPRVDDVGGEEDFFGAASEARVLKRMKAQPDLELESVSSPLAGRLPPKMEVGASEAVGHVDAVEAVAYGEQHEAGHDRTGENGCAPNDACEDHTHVSTASEESESTSPPPVNIPPVECGHSGDDAGHGDLADVSSSISPLREGGEEEEEEWSDGRVVERGADMNSRSLTPDVPCPIKEQHGDEHYQGIVVDVESGGKGEPGGPRDDGDVGDCEGKEERCVSGDGVAELKKEEERAGDHGADGGAFWSRQHDTEGHGGSDTEEEDILAGGTQRSTQAHGENGGSGGGAMVADGVYGDGEETDDDDIRSPASKLPPQTRNLEDDMDREQEEDGDEGGQVDRGSNHDEQSNVGHDSSTLSSSSSTQSVSPSSAAAPIKGGDHQQDAGVDTAATNNDSADEIEIVATIPGAAAEAAGPEVIEISDDDD